VSRSKLFDEAHPFGPLKRVHSALRWKKPFALRLAINGSVSIIVEDGERVVEIRFVSVQAARVTTADAFLSPGLLPSDGVYEVTPSPWVVELRAVLVEADPDATFLDDAHHYIVVGYDDVVEVISRDEAISIRLATGADEPPDESGLWHPAL